jgi:hypothetical protein
MNETIFNDDWTNLLDSNKTDIIFESSTTNIPKSKNKSVNIKNLDICQIIILNQNNLNSKDLIDAQQQIFWKIKENFALYKNNLIPFLSWILNASSILANRANVHYNTNNCNHDSKIIRSSYKFCELMDHCQYNYSKNNHGCKYHHYVHNNVYCDVLSIINHINSGQFNEIEIIKSINTLWFVVNHMFIEISNLEKDFGLLYESFHKVKHLSSKKNIIYTT